MMRQNLRLEIKVNKIVLVMFLISLAWTLSLFTAPMTVESGTLTDLSGVTNIKDNEDRFRDLNWFAKAIYKSGDVMCHTKAERSYYINGNQMPYCARDVGIFTGLSLGIFLSFLIITEIKIWWFVVGLIPMGVDGGVQLLTSYESTNPLRVLTGGLAGIVLGYALAVIIIELQSFAPPKKYKSPEDNKEN